MNGPPAELLIGPDRPKQLRQPRDVDGDPSRLVIREHLRLSGISLGLPTVEIRECLPGGVADDVAPGHFVGAPGRRKAAWRFCHGGTNYGDGSRTPRARGPLRLPPPDARHNLRPARKLGSSHHNIAVDGALTGALLGPILPRAGQSNCLSQPGNTGTAPGWDILTTRLPAP
jgi:hypothetical protein